MDDRVIFGNNLRFLRKKHGLTQKQLAKLLNVSTYCIQKAEQGIFADSLYVDTLWNICRQFHLPIITLFTPHDQWKQ